MMYLAIAMYLFFASVLVNDLHIPSPPTPRQKKPFSFLVQNNVQCSDIIDFVFNIRSELGT